MEKHELREKKDEFIELRGFFEYSLDRCVEMLGISKTSLIKWEKENTEAISTLKQARFNQMVDTLELSAVGRLERLRELNKRLREEVESRDLTNLPDDKLIKLYLESLDKMNKFIDAQGLKQSVSTFEFPFSF